jgi:hypothetical protein
MIERFAKLGIGSNISHKRGQAFAIGPGASVYAGIA